MKKSSLVLYVLILTLAVSLSPRAQAYLCSRVPPQGPSLFWMTRDVPIVVNRQGSERIVDGSDIDAVRASLRTWSDVSCSDMQLRDAGQTDKRAAGYSWHDPEDNENLIVWRTGHGDALDDWDHEIGSIAVTTTTYNSRTGEILDADIEFNDVSYQFSACTPPEAGCVVSYDVQNTVTHELGHVLGLDHPPSSQPGASEATMYFSAPRGETKKRTLEADDEEGLCFLYPTGEAAGHCYGQVAQDVSEPDFQQIGQNSDTGCICAGSAGRTASPGLFFIIFSIFALAVLRRLALY